MRLIKYHGIGNDFLLLEDYAGRLGPPASLPRALVTALCDRYTGVGADGVIRVIGAEGDAATAAAGAQLRMDLYNADGGPAEMSGNGMRCLAVLARAAGRLDGPGDHAVLGGAGLVHVRFEQAGTVAVDMGPPALRREDVPMTGAGDSLRVGIEVGGAVLEGTGVGMGNPHVVLFTSDLGRPLDDELVTGLGPLLEVHGDFPQRVNVEFVDVVSPGELRMRVWERGVGETLACGTGSCAAAVAAASLGRAERRVVVHQPGGDVDVDWAGDGHVWLSGPVERVFAAEVDAAWLEARGLGDHVSILERAAS